MDLIRTLGLSARLLTGLALAFALMAAIVPARGSFAQEQFFTQSGGRGLQNAKTNARLTKVETDVDAVKVQVAKIQPFAYAQLGTCAEDGEKLRWDGTNWICESETDPTVQPWAKKALPTCGAGTILGVTNGEFGCVSVGFVSSEVDPTVQNWAKTPLPSCGPGEVLSVAGDKSLSCTKDFQGLMSEKDPFVHEFARTDVVPVLPNCNINESLTMTGGRLICRTNAMTITEETDPKVQDFARNDIAGATISACAVGEVLTAASSGGHVVLQCASAGGSLAETLRLTDLSDVSITAPVSNSVLKYDGSGWVASKETDPIITELTACGSGKVLTWDGTDVSCVADIGSSGTLHIGELADVNTGGASDGNILQYSSSTSKWETTALPTCSTGKILTSNGSSFSCVNDAGGSGDPLDLNELGDVRISSGTALDPDDKDLLRWNETTSKWVPIHDKMTGAMTDKGWCYYSSVSDTVICDRGAPQQCLAGQVMSWDATDNKFGCVSATATLGLGTMSSQNADDVSITGGMINGTAIGGTNPSTASFTTVDVTTLRATTLNTTDLLATGLVRGASMQVSNGLVQGDLRVTGNMYVSGSQSFDGVTFANGGIQLSGSIIGGRMDTGSISATGNVSVTGNVSANKFIGDGSLLTSVTASSADWYNITHVPAQVQEVSRSGAIVMAGVSATNISVTNNAYVGGDLKVVGNLLVSGSQTIEGVTFAKGGIQMTGGLLGDFVSSSNLSTTLADIRNLQVTNGVLVNQDVTVTRDVGVGRNLFVTGAATIGSIGTGNIAASNVSVTGNMQVNGNLMVSGTQTIEGVTFAKGGIQLSGTITGGRVDTQDISVSQNVSVTGNVSANKFIGDGSLLTSISSSAINLAIDDLTDASSTVASGNMFLGQGSGNAITYGTSNTAMGLGALKAVTQGGSNVAIGANALNINTTGGNNVAIGNDAMVNTTAAYSNVAIGSTAMLLNNTGTANTAIGSQALSGNLTGTANTGVGSSALFDNQTGSYNTALGDIAGTGLTSGDYNIAIGVGSAFHSNTGSYQLSIGNTIYGDTYMKRIGINTTSPTTTLEVNGTISATRVLATAVSASTISGTTIQVGGAGSCASGLAGVIRYNTGTLQVCDGGNWDTLITNATTADRITSGTTNVIANGGAQSISFTVAGVTTGYFYNGQLVASAVSTTGTGKFNDVSVTRNLTVGGDTVLSGALSVPSAGIGNLTVANNLVVSGLGTMANVSVTGGVSVTGNVSAAKFIGDGSLLSGISAAGLGAAGSTGSVQFKGASGEISGTNTILWENASNNLKVSGTVQMSGTGGESCSAATAGMVRYTNTGIQFCRP